MKQINHTRGAVANGKTPSKKYDPKYLWIYKNNSAPSGRVVNTHPFLGLKSQAMLHCPSGALRKNALKGQYIPAQGNALGKGHVSLALKGRYIKHYNATSS